MQSLCVGSDAYSVKLRRGVQCSKCAVPQILTLKKNYHHNCDVTSFKTTIF